MKIRIYAILPETEPDTWDAISDVIEIVDNQYGVVECVSHAVHLFPNWLELNIERLPD